MSILNEPSKVIAKMIIRKANIHAVANGKKGHLKVASEVVQVGDFMGGDVANLDDLEGMIMPPGGWEVPLPLPLLLT